MASPFVLQNEFLGMWQDNARDSVPSGKLWNCVDLIPEYIGAPLRGRGGWGVFGNPLGSIHYTQGITVFNSDVYAVGSDDVLYSSGGSVIGTAFDVAQNPIVHRTGSTPLLVIPAKSGTTAPKSYDGSTFQNLAGTPPKAIYADVWNDHTLLANGTVGSTSFPQRLWFGPIGDAAASWDTTNAWEDTKFPIVGVAVIRTGIMVFHSSSSAFYTGTTAPSATSIGDLTLRDPVFDVGCIDARSITKYNDTVLWADGKGVYQSDGNTLKSLTATAGMQSYWRSLFSSGLLGTPAIAGGVFNDTYILSISYFTSFGSHYQFVDCLAYDLVRGFWYRMSNINTLAFARSQGLTEETYFGPDSFGQMAGLSTILRPGNGAEANPSPYYETGFFRGWQHWHRKWVPSMAIQSWKRVYLNYELNDSGNAGAITLSYALDPSSSSYTAIAPTMTSPNTAYRRQHRDIHKQGNGIMFKVSATANTDIRLHALEIEYTPLETSRLAQ